VSQQPGTLASLGVAVGARVKAGQALARLSSKSLEDQLAQSQATLEKTRRDLEKLTLEHDYDTAAAARARPGLQRAVDDAVKDTADERALVAANAAPARDLKTAQDREDAAREALAKADADGAHAAAVYQLSRRNMEADIALLAAAAGRLQEAIDDLTVRAPFDGTIMEVNAQLGAFISQYQKLFHLADTAHPQVVLDVPEDSVPGLAAGQQVTVINGAGRFSGTIERIGLEAQVGSSGSSATVPVYVTPAAVPGGVLPGSSATGEITLGTKKGALVLPRGPYLSSGNERWVYRISGGEAVRTEVSYGIIQADEVEVVAGLQAGDRIVTSGYQDYIDRERVRLRPEGDRQ
jgi:HlyD family secretion protein